MRSDLFSRPWRHGLATLRARGDDGRFMAVVDPWGVDFTSRVIQILEGKVHVREPDFGA